MEMIIAGKYRVGRKLGGGAFGDVHLGTDVTNGKEVAIKLEPTSVDIQQLAHEADLYKRFRGGRGIANTLWSGVHRDYNVLVMDVLGPSLQDMFIFCGHRFSLKTVLLIIDQVLDRLEHVHEQGHIHMDVKPDNFLVGLGDQHETIFIIDFGLTKRYRDENSRQHLPCRTDQKLTGTARYASLNSHLGIERSRRDDLESLAYVLVYFLRGDLPWQRLKASTKKEKNDRIMHCKKNTSTKDLCKGLPPEFEWFLEYCRGLKFDETPNYYQMKRVFKDLLYREGLNGDQTFDWTLKRHRLSLDRRRKQQKQNQQQPDHYPQQQRQQGCAEDTGATGEYLGRHHSDDYHEASATESDVEMKPSPSLKPEEHDERPPDTSGTAEEGRKPEIVGAHMPPVADHARSPTQEYVGPPVALPYPGSPSTKNVNPPRADHAGLKAKEEVLRTREPGVKRGHERGHGWRSEVGDARRYSSVPVGGPNGASGEGEAVYGFIHQAGASVPAETTAPIPAPLVDRYTRTEPPPGTTSLLFPPLSSHLCPNRVLGQNGSRGEGSHLVSPAGTPSSGKIGGSRNGSGGSSVNGGSSGGGGESNSGGSGEGNGSGGGSGSGSESGNGNGSGNGTGNGNGSGSGNGIGNGSGSGRGTRSRSGNGSGSSSNNSSSSSGGGKGSGGSGNDGGSGGSGSGNGSGSSTGIDGGGYSVIQPRLIQPNNHRAMEEVGTSRAEAMESNDDAIKMAIATYRPPAGRRRVPVPAPRCGRSLLYMYGVITEDDVPEPDPKKMQFHCLASPECRHASKTGTGAPIPIQKKATGNGTRHLKTVHNIESLKTRNERDKRGHFHGTEAPIEEQKVSNNVGGISSSSSSSSNNGSRQQILPPGLLEPPPQQVLMLPTNAEPSAPTPPYEPESGQNLQQGPRQMSARSPRSPPQAYHPHFHLQPQPQPQYQCQLHHGQTSPIPPPSGPSPRMIPSSMSMLPLPVIPTTREVPYSNDRFQHREYRSNGAGAPPQALQASRSQSPPAAAVASAGFEMRSMALSFVNLFVVSQLRGFDVCEDPAVRDFLTACAAPGFPRERLSVAGMKHYVEELYEALKNALILDMHGVCRSHRHSHKIRGAETGGDSSESQPAAASSFHASFELWNTSYDGRGGLVGGGGGGGDGWNGRGSRVQGEKYICLRVHWLTQEFAHRTASLAVRRWPYQLCESSLPHPPNVGGRRLAVPGENLNRWMRDVLEEYGVEMRRLFSTVTDVDDDEHRGTESVAVWKLADRVSTGTRVFARMSGAGVSWEWSIAHMLDTVLAEAFGILPLRSEYGGGRSSTTLDVINMFQALVTDLANDTLLWGWKLAFRDVRLATHSAYMDRSDVFPRCWVTTARVIEHTLANWTELKEHYADHRATANPEMVAGMVGGEDAASTTIGSTRFPLANQRALVEELYSVMKPLAAVIERTQVTPQASSDTGPTCITSLVDLATLRLTVAEPSKPLLVYLPHKPAPAEAARGGAQAQGEPVIYNTSKMSRSIAELNVNTKDTRERLRVALDKHFFGPRYNERYQNHHCEGIGGGIGRVDTGSGGGNVPSNNYSNSAINGNGNVDNEKGSSPPTRKVDYVLEMVSCMDPFLSQLFLVDSLASSTGYAAKIKSNIWDKVVSLAVSLAEAEEASAEAGAKRQRHCQGLSPNLERSSRHSQEITEGEDVVEGIGNARQPSSVTSRFLGHPLDGGTRKRPRLVLGPHIAVSDENGGSVSGGSSVSSSEAGAEAATASTGFLSPEPSSSEDGAGSRNFDVSYILESGLFGSAPHKPKTRAKSHKERAEAELEAFKALGSKRTFGAPPLKDLLPFWASEGEREFPYLARTARVLLAFPTSSIVSERQELRGAEDRLLGRRKDSYPVFSASISPVMERGDAVGRGRVLGQGASRVSDQGYAEMALMLHCNKEAIPYEIPAMEQADLLSSAPRRWLEPFPESEDR